MYICSRIVICAGTNPSNVLRSYFFLIIRSAKKNPLNPSCLPHARRERREQWRGEGEKEKNKKGKEKIGIGCKVHLVSTTLPCLDDTSMPQWLPCPEDTPLCQSNIRFLNNSLTSLSHCDTSVQYIGMRLVYLYNSIHFISFLPPIAQDSFFFVLVSLPISLGFKKSCKLPKAIKDTDYSIGMGAVEQSSQNFDSYLALRVLLKTINLDSWKWEQRSASKWMKTSLIVWL